MSTLLEKINWTAQVKCKLLNKTLGKKVLWKDGCNTLFNAAPFQLNSAPKRASCTFNDNLIIDLKYYTIAIWMLFEIEKNCNVITC